MKLRIRPVPAAATIRLDVDGTASLLDLKTLIATNIYSGSGAVPAESVRISLNRSDELVAPAGSPSASLASIGITSGDLIFCSLSPFSSPSSSGTLVPSVTYNEPALSQVTHPSAFSGTYCNTSSAGLLERDEITSAAFGIRGDSNVRPFRAEMALGNAARINEETKKPLLVPQPKDARFLCPAKLIIRALDAEKELGADTDVLRSRAAIAVHAALMDSGFRVYVSGQPSSHLPHGWTQAVDSDLVVEYHIPKLVGSTDIVTLKFSALGHYVSVYGYFGSNGNSDVYRLCVDASKLSFLSSSSHSTSMKEQEKEMLEVWNSVKDEVCLPLLIDLCLHNSLPLPACFASLTVDVKVKILELVRGVDLAVLGCTCLELKTLTSNEELWEKKCNEEFISANTKGSWKLRYATAWVAKRNAAKRQKRNAPFRLQRLFSYQQRPMFGGDYDRFPVFGNGGLRAVGNRRTSAQQRPSFMLNCNLR